MSSINPVAGGSAGWVSQINQAAAQATKHVDRDGDRDANKPEAPAETARDGATPVSKLNIKV
jgi:hypothetical protein